MFSIIRHSIICTRPSEVDQKGNKKFRFRCYRTWSTSNVANSGGLCNQNNEGLITFPMTAADNFFVRSIILFVQDFPCEKFSINCLNTFLVKNALLIVERHNRNNQDNFLAQSILLILERLS